MFDTEGGTENVFKTPVFIIVQPFPGQFIVNFIITCRIVGFCGIEINTRIIAG